ncbi:MAG: DUF4129 domain-containing protein [Acidimicrobiales bacterium]|nr:DUF4129 domain-containing protein [Acidimicrobiales bacterium]
MPVGARAALAGILSASTVALAWVAGAGAGQPAGSPQLPSPTADPDQVRRAADEILSRPEYRPPSRSLLERFFDWLGDVLDEIFGQTFGTGGGGKGTPLLWVVLVVLAVLAVVLVRRFAATRVPKQRGAEIEVDIEPRRSADEWRHEAERLEALGEWKQALRARYRVLVGELLERRVVDDVPGRTTGEYRHEVTAAAPAVAGAFTAASDLFEQAWYGDVPTGEAENRRFRELAEQVLAGARVAEGRELVGVAAPAGAGGDGS